MYKAWNGTGNDCYRSEEFQITNVTSDEEGKSRLYLSPAERPVCRNNNQSCTQEGPEERKGWEAAAMRRARWQLESLAGGPQQGAQQAQRVARSALRVIKYLHKACLGPVKGRKCHLSTAPGEWRSVTSELWAPCQSWGHAHSGPRKAAAPVGLALLSIPSSGLADSLKIPLLPFIAMVTAHPLELFTSTHFYAAED